MRTLRIAITFINSTFFPQGALSAVRLHNRYRLLSYTAWIGWPRLVFV